VEEDQKNCGKLYFYMGQSNNFGLRLVTIHL